MQNKKIDLIKDHITAKLYEELIGSKWEIEVMGENPHFGHLSLVGRPTSKFGKEMQALHLGRKL